MGTYRQPASLVDTQSGKISRQATKEGFAAINAMAEKSIAQAEERKKKEKETEDAKKVILEAGAKRRAEGDAILNKNNVDDSSLGNGVEAPVKSLQNARIENLSLSTSDARYHENLKKVAQADMFLNNLEALMTSAVFTEKETQENLGKGIGTGGNQIAPSSVTKDWVEFNSQTRSVSTGWEASFDISSNDRGEWGMYIIGKKDDSTLKRAVNMLSEDDETGTEYNKGTYRIVPDASAEVKTVLKEDGTLKSDGGIADRYATKTQETVGNKVYDITRIDRDQLFNQTSTVANVIGENIISNGANSMVDYINSKGIKDPNNPQSNALGYISLKVDQNNNFIQENGEVVKGDWVQVTDDNGQFVQDFSFKEDTGYLSDEQYDKFMQFIQINTAADLGVFAQEQRTIDGPATERLKKSIASTNKALKPVKWQEEATKIEGTIERAFGNLESNVAEIRKTKDTKSGFPIKGYWFQKEQDKITSAFRKEMGGLITPNINFEIIDGKFYPVREKLRTEVEDGEETMFKDYVPIIDEGYDIFTEMDKIKTYLEEKFVPIEVKTVSTGGFGPLAPQEDASIFNK